MTSTARSKAEASSRVDARLESPAPHGLAASTEAGTRPPWVEVGLLFALIVVGAIVTWNRVPAGHRDRVWAEDGNIFLAEAVERGPWTVLFEGYAGYQHFVPRLVAAIVLPFLDLAQYPVVIFAICAGLTGLAAGAVFWLSRDVVPWLPARLALGLTTVLIPLATQETVGNLADLHTYAMWVAPWLLLYRPRSWGASAGWAVVMWAIVMTEIQAVFFFFLILFRLRTRDRIQWPVFGGFLVGSAVQIATSLVVDRKTGEGPLSIPSTVLGWMINSVMPVITADPQAIRAWVVESGMLVAVLILIPVVVATVVVICWGTPSQRLLTVALLLGSAAIYTGSAWANSGFWFAYAEEDLSDLGIRLALNIRYGVASGMMLVAVVVISTAVLRHRWGRGVVARGLSWLVCVGVVATLAHGSTMTVSIRDQVPRWSSAVDRAVEACSTLDAPAVVTLPVAPDRSVDLTCADVLVLSPR